MCPVPALLISINSFHLLNSLYIYTFLSLDIPEVGLTLLFILRMNSIDLTAAEKEMLHLLFVNMLSQCRYKFLHATTVA